MMQTDEYIVPPAAQVPFHYDAFRFNDPERIDAIVDSFPLALFISTDGPRPLASHVPLLRMSGSRNLFGHVDAANPQFAGLRRIHAHIVFMGPDSYIPPEAYVTRQLPTWNYVSVHMSGVVEIINDLPRKLEVLRETAAFLQPDDAPYQFDAQDERVKRFAPHILALRVTVEHEEARIKLSQDKGPSDQHAALDHLLANRARSPRPLLETFLQPLDASTDD
ncbi:FMN-binding negative transcriptional regulator [Paraburkholderia sp. MMS20-SJTR3]|uniref:FMN-binding negative transcriptional regulator n=1 Tax=Paraburkholderia sejongensis TaxID=2886946 RepID=A0ABS8K5A0_9BURK|nr:FMN-binding negative transcriptional regulator [Paraburkholderia sp. MMS20-SJTR3]MCC8397336.1 FMN-binding negative transcriptional regulator [Paraburkholderia sp. MMS20-SJTR3]